MSEFTPISIVKKLPSWTTPAFNPNDAYPIFTPVSIINSSAWDIFKPKNKFNEKQFQNEIRNTEWFKEFVRDFGEEPDLNTKDYDYRKAWAAGVRPVRDPYDKNRYHWSSSLNDGTMLKSEDHPTAWKEYYMRLTGKNPDEVGATKQDYLNLINK